MSNNNTDDNQRIDHTNPNELKRLYHDEGMTLAEVVEKTTAGGHSTVRYHMNKHGIDRRDPSEFNKNLHAGITTEKSGHMSWYSDDPDGQRRTMKVHRLVAIAEHGADAVAGNHVHHKNEIPWDNRPSNLEIKSPKDHHSHHSTGESHPGSKLTESDVKDILSRLKAGETGRSLANEYGVSETTISMIKNGNNWAHIGDRD